MSDLEAALKLFNDFHGDIQKRVTLSNLKIPATVRYLELARELRYVAPSGRWSHVFTGRVGVYAPGGAVPVPEWLRAVQNLVKLGQDLDTGADIYTDPYGQALVLITGSSVVRLLWGEGLQVQARGIVG